MDIFSLPRGQAGEASLKPNISEARREDDAQTLSSSLAETTSLSPSSVAHHFPHNLICPNARF